MKPVEGHEYIWLEMPVDKTLGYEPGYYFEDEAGGLNGPFGTIKETEAALKEYCDYYL